MEQTLSLVTLGVADLERVGGRGQPRLDARQRRLDTPALTRERGAATRQDGQCMSGLGPLRSNVCADIGWPHSGHDRSVRTGSGSVSNGPTDAGPARRISRLFQ